MHRQITSISGSMSMIYEYSSQTYGNFQEIQCHCQWGNRQGKWLIKIPCRENSGNFKILQNSGNFNLIFFLICWSSFSWTMIYNACMCSGKFNVLKFFSQHSPESISMIYSQSSCAYLISDHGTFQLGHVRWVKVSRLASASTFTRVHAIVWVNRDTRFLIC